jgi:hypothetical protein
MIEGSGSIMDQDADPGDPKTDGSGSGFRSKSTTLVLSLLYVKYLYKHGTFQDGYP